MLTEIPSQYTSGTSVTCQFVITGYPASEGWAAKLALRGPGAKNVDATVDGDAFVFVLPDDVSPGTYWYQVAVSKDSERHIPLSGEVEVQTDLFAEDAAYDGRSKARKALNAIDVCLEGTAIKAVWSYKINGKELQHYSVTQLMELRRHFALQVNRERPDRNKFKSFKVRI